MGSGAIGGGLELFGLLVKAVPGLPFRQARVALNFQVIEDAESSITAFKHGRNDEVGAAYHVATSKHFGVAGLECGAMSALVGYHTTTAVGFDADLLEPRGWRWAETKSD